MIQQTEELCRFLCAIFKSCCQSLRLCIVCVCVCVCVRACWTLMEWQWLEKTNEWGEKLSQCDLFELIPTRCAVFRTTNCTVSNSHLSVTFLLHVSTFKRHELVDIETCRRNITCLLLLLLLLLFAVKLVSAECYIFSLSNGLQVTSNFKSHLVQNGKERGFVLWQHSK